MPKSSMPALLLITVRSLAPCSRNAWMRFSGMPHSPKPPIMMVAPSPMSLIAWSASRMTLFNTVSWSPRGLNRGGLIEEFAGATTWWRRLAAPPLCRADDSS